MICDSKSRYAISNLGWVDQGDLWTYCNQSNEIKKIKLFNSKYLNIFDGKDDYFSILHNYENNRFDISVHHFDKIEEPLCRLTFDNNKQKFEGDIDKISFVPRFYVIGLNLNKEFNFHLLNIQGGEIQFEDPKISWYHNGDFDFGYQGLIGITEFNNELLFCVQRSSFLYRVNKESKWLISKIELAKSYGNPKLAFNDDKSLIFIDDYDTLLKINPANWKVEGLKKLQNAKKGTSQFIGSYSLNKINDLITVPRPFSSDVIMVDRNFKIKYICKTGKQPIEAVLLEGDNPIARDWKTGDLLTGKMKRISIFKRLRGL